MQAQKASLSTGNRAVDAVGTMSISGNVIPQSWYRTITKETGKPYLAAIVILSDIVYWYRPTEERDESTGRVVAMRKKFKSDLLQRSYSQIAEQFGITKRDATNAIVALERLGVIRRVFRKIEVGGMTLSNVLFLALDPDRLAEITFPETPVTEDCGGYHSNRGEGQPKSVTPKTQIGDTYTETSQETSQESSTEREEGADAPEKRKRFVPPSVEEIASYCSEKGYSLTNPTQLWNHYENVNWYIGRRKMRDWKKAVDNWEIREREWHKTPASVPASKQAIVTRDPSENQKWGLFDD